jgi:hypothetical protein
MIDNRFELRFIIQLRVHLRVLPGLAFDVAKLITVGFFLTVLLDLHLNQVCSIDGRFNRQDHDALSLAHLVSFTQWLTATLPPVPWLAMQPLERHFFFRKPLKPFSKNSWPECCRQRLAGLRLQKCGIFLVRNATCSSVVQGFPAWSQQTSDYGVQH